MHIYRVYVSLLNDMLFCHAIQSEGREVGSAGFWDCHTYTNTHVDTTRVVLKWISRIHSDSMYVKYKPIMISIYWLFEYIFVEHISVSFPSLDYSHHAFILLTKLIRIWSFARYFKRFQCVLGEDFCLRLFLCFRIELRSMFMFLFVFYF